METVTFTFLPNGIREQLLDNGKVARVLGFSLFLTPKLGQNGTLGDGQFPVFEQWTKHANSLMVSLDIQGAVFPGTGSRVRPVLALSALQPDYWPLVLPGSTPVVAWSFKDQTTRTLRSYSTTLLREQILGMYNDVAQDLDTATNHPSLDGSSPVRTFIDTLAPIRALLDRYRTSLDSGKITDPNNVVLDQMASQLSGQPAQFFQALRFYKRPQGKLTAKEFPPPPTVPAFDFHQALAMMSDHGSLLRLLGIVIDGGIVVPPGAKVPNQSAVRVDAIAFGDGTQGLTLERPWTQYRIHGGHFAAQSKSGSDIRDGFLELANQKHFDVFEMDVDGAALKTTDFALSLGRQIERTQTQTTNKPETATLPALRSAGFSLVRKQRTADIQDRLQSATQINSNPNAALLFADDITRGYRMDVLFRDSWYSLCQREGTLNIGSGSSAVALAVADEGYVKAVSGTSSRDPDVTVDELYLHEALVTWKGWSLVARRPGRVIPAPPKTDMVRPTNSIQTNLAIVPDYHVQPGSLPRLRFGDWYRFRLRTVDLAGNGWPADVASSDTFWQSEEVPYFRYEPVPAPALVPQAAMRDGDAIETLVIRSEVLIDDPPSGSGIYNSETTRHVAPPKASQQMVEQHGTLDALFKSDPALAFRLSCKEKGTFMDQEIVDPYDPVFDASKYPAKLVPVTGLALVEGSAELPWPDPAPKLGDPLPAGQYVVHQDDQLALPYLPDPLAAGLALRTGLGGVAIHRFRGAWPDLQPFRLILRSGTPDITPLSDGNVEITLEEGTMARLRYSSLPRSDSTLPVAEQIRCLAFAQDLSDTLFNSAMLGQHWMLTPYRELLLVHAVQKPLADPVVQIGAYKELGKTYAQLTGNVTSESHSTVQAEIHAHWTEPVDIGDDGPKPVEHQAYVFTRKIAYEEPVAPIPKEKGGNPPRHEFGDTKHRMVSYRAVGTTRYKEYFPPEITSDKANITRKGPHTELVNILSSARPDPPRVLYVVPTFRWETSADGLTSKRVGRGLRVYLDRPWFSSGAGELLAVALAKTPISADDMDDIRAYVSEWGADPLRNDTPPTAELVPQRFTNRALVLPEVELAERHDVTVRAVGFPVEYAAGRKLWRCDIEMDIGSLYFPFVRLALARLQPNSVTSPRDVRLSNVVKTEFAQLTADRTVTLVLAPGSVRVTLSGVSALNDYGVTQPAPAATPAPPGSGLNPAPARGVDRNVVVHIERRPRIASTAPKNPVDWKQVGDELTLPSYSSKLAPAEVFWSRDVPWADRDTAYEYRLVVREYEIYFTDPEVAGTIDQPIGFIPVSAAQRLVHLDTIPLRP